MFRYKKYLVNEYGELGKNNPKSFTVYEVDKKNNHNLISKVKDITSLAKEIINHYKTNPPKWYKLEKEGYLLLTTPMKFLPLGITLNVNGRKFGSMGLRNLEELKNEVVKVLKGK